MLTWIEVNAAAIRHNLRQFRKKIGPHVLLMPVIKRNAYGHGFLEVASIVAAEPVVDRVCVASLEEAAVLLRNGFKKPIIILSFYELSSKECLLAIKRGVAFPVYSLEQAKKLNQLAKTVRTKAVLHLKIDTGTSRLGVLPSEATTLARYITKQRYLTLEGLWSHFSSSEHNHTETKRQEKIFNSVISELRQQGIEPPLKHISCSASTILYPSTHFNAVRIGLSTYGLYPSESCRPNIALKAALSWHTKLIQIKKIPTGTAVSYGMTYKVTRPTILGVLPIGYSDGYDRSLSSRATVLVHGRRCRVLGRICMNLTMIDLTDLSYIPQTGEKVTLLGGTGPNTITADELASLAGTINYEIIDRLNPLIPRRVT